MVSPSLFTRLANSRADASARIRSPKRRLFLHGRQTKVRIRRLQPLVLPSRQAVDASILPGSELLGQANGRNDGLGLACGREE